jgi:hypothetical protein
VDAKKLYLRDNNHLEYYEKINIIEYLPKIMTELQNGVLVNTKNLQTVLTKIFLNLKELPTLL